MRFFIFLALLLLQPLYTLKAVQTDICPEIVNAPDSQKLPLDPELPKNDLNRVIKDFGTDIVTKNFFKSSNSLYSFLNVVYLTVDKALNEYKAKNGLDDKSIYLIFKGGNVLRIIAEGVLNAVNPAVRKILEEKYLPYFKRSDADFTVLIDEKLLNGLDYDQVFSDVTNLVYDKQVELRNEFESNSEKYFDFMQLKKEIASKELAEYEKKLEDNLKEDYNEKWSNVKFTQLQILDDAANEKLNCPYQGQNDFKIEFSPEDKSNIILSKINDKPNWLAISINNALEFPSEKNPADLTKFSLVRTKVAFEYFYTSSDNKLKLKKEGGELIDISIRHKKDFRLREFLDNYADEIENFTLVDGDKSFIMKAESIRGLENDLKDILFVLYKRPWDASKYEKRVNRLFFLYTAEMLGTEGGINSPRTKDYLKEIREKIINNLHKLYPMNENTASFAQTLENNAHEIAENYPEMSSLNTFIFNLTELIQTDLVKNPIENDESKFQDFLDVIEENYSITEEISTMSQPQIDLMKVYIINIVDLL